MSERRDLGALWHGLITAVVGALIAAFWIVREKIQHPASKLREWSRHRRLEATAGSIALVIVGLGFALWIWLV